MRILVFDTETSGLDPQWNVILQLSYQIVDSDSWATQKAVNHYFSWPENKARVTQVNVAQLQRNHVHTVLGQQGFQKQSQS